MRGAKAGAMIAECPVHELTAGLGKGQSDFDAKYELKSLLQDSRNWPYHQAGAYTHLKQNLRIKAGSRYILLGKNGVGKSTLLRAIADRDNGLEEFPKNCETFLLDQELEFLKDAAENETVTTLVHHHASARLQRLQAEADRLERSKSLRSSEDEDEDDEGVCERLCDLYDEIEELEGETAEKKQEALALLKGLGFLRRGLEHAPLSSLSGGWRARVGLACALMHRPQFLLLDEPTNHLDITAITWLERYLIKRYNGDALLFVTHDRDFAEKVATDVILFANKSLQYFNHTLRSFEQVMEDKSIKQQHQAEKLEAKKAQIKGQISTAQGKASKGDANMGKKVAQLTKKLGRTGLEKSADGHRFKAQNQGVRIGANNNNDGGWVRGKMTASAIDSPTESTLRFGFKQRQGKQGMDEGMKAFELRSPAISFGDFTIKGPDLPIYTNCRLALVGANGAGKSTLLKMLVGELLPSRGSIERMRYRFAYMNQLIADQLKADERTPVHRLLDAKPGQKEMDVRSHLGRFGVHGAEAVRPLNQLSGGQRVRCAMALEMLNEPTILILDEPTNHLDMSSVDALGESLKDFDGGLIVSTHDRALIRSVARDILLVQNGSTKLLGAEEYLNSLKR